MSSTSVRLSVILTHTGLFFGPGQGESPKRDLDWSFADGLYNCKRPVLPFFV